LQFNINELQHEHGDARDASDQWEILKHNIEGYQEFADARHEAKVKEYMDVERQHGLQELQKFEDELHQHPEPLQGARGDGTTSNGRSGARSRVPADEAVAPKPPAEWRRAVAEAITAAEQLMKIEEESRPTHNSSCGSINVLLDADDALIATATEKVTVRPALDSGSVDNVIHPRELPRDADPVPNETDSHFVGANNSRIEKFGTCTTCLESECGQVGCDWQLADVTRPLHSVSKVAGPKDGPGKQDVLFSNKKAVVVPPGIVEEILKRVRPIAEYEREGNLYVCRFEMSAFARRSQSP
jgi:hypothetical protein